MTNFELTTGLPADTGDTRNNIEELAEVTAKNDHYPGQVELLEQQDGLDTNLVLRTGGMKDIGEIAASITEVNGEPKAMVEGFGVSSRGRGDGTRLMQALVVTLKQRGVHELWSYSVSADALKFREKFFGDANLHFYDPNHPENGFLPLSVDDAIATSERLDELKVSEIPGGKPMRPLNSKGKPNYNFGLCVDLDQVDSTG